MVPYIVVFALTTLLAYVLGRKVLEDATSPKRILFAICVCAPVVFLASIRDYSIGTDVLVYGKSSFELACAHSLPSYYQITAGNYGIGYTLLCWIISNTFMSMPVFLGAIELVAFLPVVLACFKMSLKYAWVGICIYLLLFYGGTLNYLRQGMALGFILFSVSCLLKQEWKSSLMLFVIAESLHQTAVLAIPIYLLIIYYLFIFKPGQEVSKRGKVLVRGIACIAALAVVLFGRSLIVTYSSLKESYADQVSRLGTGGINLIITILLILIVLLLYMHAKSKECRASQVSDCLVLVIVIGFLLRFLTIWQAQLERVGLFYLACCALAASAISANLKRGDRTPFIISVIAASFLYFFFYYVHYGYSEIVPFVVNSSLL